MVGLFELVKPTRSFSTNLLHPKKMIDQVPYSRQIMATAIAQQFFGCFITMNSW